MDQTMIEMKHVIKMYENGIRAVNGISLSFAKSTNTLITGPASSGKTTLMKMIAGIEPPSAGSIIVNGQAIHMMDGDMAAGFRNLTFGIINRKQCFINHLTVTENIVMPLTLRKICAAERISAAKKQMNRLHITHKQSAYPSQLSLLDKHLVCLARALITNPPILLMDSFGTDLPPRDRERLYEILHDIVQNECKMTIIRFADINDELQTDQVIRLRYGKVV